ncbi:hypothetical protein D3C73_583800 [compost metagenome]
MDRHGDDQFVSAGFREKVFQLCLNGRHRADCGVTQRVLDAHLFHRCPQAIHAVQRPGEAGADILAQVDELLLRRGEQTFGFFIGVCGDAHDPNHDIGLFQFSGRLEAFAIDRNRIQQHVGGEVGSEGIGQTERRREMGAVEAGAEEPDRYIGLSAGDSNDRLVLDRRAEQVLQFDDVLRKVLGTGIHVASKRAGGAHVGAGSAAEAEIDTAGQQRFQRTELFSNHERGMVGQHDATGTDANFLRSGADMGDNDRGRSAGYTGHAMVFGKPDTLVSLLFGLDCHLAGLIKRIAHRVAFADRRKVKYRERNHRSTLERNNSVVPI